MAWLARRVAQAGLVLLGALLALELVLQVAARLAPERGGSWRPGARQRVLALGDSHTWGSGVSRDEAYPAQLQRALDGREPGAFSVLNLGLPGMSTTQLRNRFALLLHRYRPDTVVIWCGANNLWNHAERDHAATPLLLQLDGWLSRLRSYRLLRVWLHDRPLESMARAREDAAAWEVEGLDTVRSPEQRFALRHDGVEERITHLRGEEDETRLHARTLADLSAIADSARAAGVDLVLVTYPVEEGFFAETNRAIREAAARHELPVVESSRALARIPPAEQSWAWALHPDARLYGEVARDLIPLLLPVRSPRETSRACEAEITALERGFGAPGPHPLERHVISNPLFPELSVFVFTPADASGPVPLVVFAHGNGHPQPESYQGLVRHVVGTGRALVYPSHQLADDRHARRYAALWSGLEAAVHGFGERFDLTRVGLVGHSYGAGALLHLARRALVDEGWGGEGAFLFSMAPWYALGLEGRDPAHLPSHLKALFLVFEVDRITDPRLAIAQRASLPPEVESDYLLVRSDRHRECRLPGLHTLPQSRGLGGRDDALDERVVFRLLDALAAYAFDGDEEARRVALGRGDPAQVSLGRWRDGTPLRPLVWSESPEPPRPESDYMFPASARDEVRAAFARDAASD